MYRIIFTSRALKDLEAMDKDTQNRIAKKLKEYAENPFKYARKLISPQIGTYRFKIGEYRVIFDIENLNLPVSRLKGDIGKANTSL